MRAVKALLLENIHPEATRILTAKGYEVLTQTKALGEADLIAALEGVDLLGIRSATSVTQAVLEAPTTSLTAIGAFCIGTNQIDLPAAAAYGVPVFNAPYSNTRSVVELAIGEIICLARRLMEKDGQMHDGVWDKSAKGSHEIRGRTLGIVGYGNIGSQLSVIAEAMGMRVVFYDIADKLALGNAHRMNSLEELLDEAECVSLHVDGRPENAGFFGEAEFARMRPRSLFLNLCRGPVVDVDALVAHLESGHIAGAALDVFPTEPKRAGEPFDSPLRGVPNVILTPHVGGSTQEAQFDIGRFVAHKLAEYAETGSTGMCVNLPQVQPLGEGGARVVHLHRNVPGVMARLNSILARYGLNIGAQTLATMGDLGYSVTDLCGSDFDGLLAELEAMDETVRVRVLGVRGDR